MRNIYDIYIMYIYIYKEHVGTVLYEDNIFGFFLFFSYYYDQTNHNFVGWFEQVVGSLDVSSPLRLRSAPKQICYILRYIHSLYRREKNKCSTEMEKKKFSF